MLIKITLIGLIVAALGVAAAAYKFGFIMDPSPAVPVSERSIYDFTVRDIDGKDVRLDSYRGKVLLVVNTASNCGYTPQYEGLQALYDRNKDNGLVILGFPANNFLGQEPGTEAEIKEFCQSKYKVTFPMFAKISVKGQDQHLLYNFLTNKATNPEFAGDISWNFNKFLIDRNGRVVARFGSKDAPDSQSVVDAVNKALVGK